MNARVSNNPLTAATGEAYPFSIAPHGRYGLGGPVREHNQGARVAPFFMRGIQFLWVPCAGSRKTGRSLVRSANPCTVPTLCLAAGVGFKPKREDSTMSTQTPKGAIRPKSTDNLINSLEALLGIVQRHPGTSGARVIASVLCSLYNGGRCKVDLTDLRLLDAANFEHVINVLRLDHSPAREVHEYFENGGAIWEGLFAEYGFDQGGHSHD